MPVLDPPNVPAFSCERQREAEGRPAALVSCNALLAGLLAGVEHQAIDGESRSYSPETRGRKGPKLLFRGHVQRDALGGIVEWKMIADESLTSRRRHLVDLPVQLRCMSLVAELVDSLH